ncbi:hypothetical protein NPX79_01105 [Spiroplasma endosymbiont of Anurida maritima]|uniref:hypothetical protein n=1 Tax=Spiroplasma endosymbiont of Anurida maritima TaxID=2967972 RepID=UPI0036D3F964
MFNKFREKRNIDRLYWNLNWEIILRFIMLTGAIIGSVGGFLAAISVMKSYYQIDVIVGNISAQYYKQMYITFGIVGFLLSILFHIPQAIIFIRHITRKNLKINFVSNIIINIIYTTLIIGLLTFFITYYNYMSPMVILSYVAIIVSFLTSFIVSLLFFKKYTKYFELFKENIFDSDLQTNEDLKRKMKKLESKRSSFLKKVEEGDKRYENKK